MVEGMKPAPQAPLQTYVQFLRTTPDDPKCVQPLEWIGMAPYCIGVTSSPEPISKYGFLREPIERSGNSKLQLNASTLFPIYGSHTRVRELHTNKIVAEEWQFSIRNKVFHELAWFTGQNPKAQIRAAEFLTVAQD